MRVGRSYNRGLIFHVRFSLFRFTFVSSKSFFFRHRSGISLIRLLHRVVYSVFYRVFFLLLLLFVYVTQKLIKLSECRVVAAKPNYINSQHRMF